MSDDGFLRCGNKEVFQLVVGNTIEPVLPCRPQWVPCGTQASSSSSLQSNEPHAAANASKDQKGQCNLPIETMKPSYTCECKSAWRCNFGKQDPTSYMAQSVEAQGCDNGKYTITENCVLNRSGFKTLEKFPEQKFPAFSINWENITSYHFQNSIIPTSEWSHFPMFDINRKLESILAPKKMTSSDTMEARMNERLFSLRESPLPTHLREFASEGQHQQQKVTQIGEEMRPYFGLAFNEHFANASLGYLKDNIACFGSSGTRMKDGSSPYSNYVPHPHISEECSEERGIACGRNRTTSGPSNSNRIQNCSTSGSRNGESEKSSSGSKHLPMTKEVGRDLCRKDKIAGGSTFSSNVKGTALFERAALPAFLHHHGQQEKNLEDAIDSRYMNREDRSLVIADPMHIAQHGKPGSPDGTYLICFILLQLSY